MVLHISLSRGVRRVRRFPGSFRGTARWADAPRPRRASRPRQLRWVGDQEFCHAQLIQRGDDGLAGDMAAFHPAVATLADPADRLRPAKDLLNAFADALAHRVSRTAPDAQWVPVVAECGVRPRRSRR